MQIILKYPVPITDIFELELPKDSEVLCFQVQGNQPMIWVLQDPQQPKIHYLFHVIGTGCELHDIKLGKYIGTIQHHGVWHLFIRASDVV